MERPHDNPALQVKVATTSPAAAWPSPQDYNEAIQNPDLSFEDPVLRLASPELNSLGLPKPSSGAFASVYRLRVDGKDFAVRCFLHPLLDQQERYAALAYHLKVNPNPALVEFAFLPRGIRVGGRWYPVVKMDWVEGTPFLSHVEANLFNPQILRGLARQLKHLLTQLQASGIAHGDLQHGNILIEDGHIRLVDYDGCFVPSLLGRDSNELGHPNYQHPLRTASHFNSHIDHFSAWVIWSSLLALAEDPSLWERLKMGDDCLLYRRGDLNAPHRAEVSHVLENHENEYIRLHSRFIRKMLEGSFSDVPPLLDDIADPSGLTPLQSVVPPPPPNLGDPVGHAQRTMQIKQKAANRRAADPLAIAKAPSRLNPAERRAIKMMLITTAACFMSLFILIPIMVTERLRRTETSAAAAAHTDKTSADTPLDAATVATASSAPAADDARIFFNLGYKAFFVRKHYEQAARYFQRALDANDNLPVAELSDFQKAQANALMGESEMRVTGDGIASMETAKQLFTKIQDSSSDAELGPTLRASIYRNDRNLADCAYRNHAYGQAVGYYLQCAADSKKQIAAENTQDRRVQSYLVKAIECARLIPNSGDSFAAFESIWQDSTVAQFPDVVLALVQSVEHRAAGSTSVDDARPLYQLQKQIAQTAGGDVTTYAEDAERALSDLSHHFSY